MPAPLPSSRQLGDKGIRFPQSGQFTVRLHKYAQTYLWSRTVEFLGMLPPCFQWYA